MKLLVFMAAKNFYLSFHFSFFGLLMAHVACQVIWKRILNETGYDQFHITLDNQSKHIWLPDEMALLMPMFSHNLVPIPVMNRSCQTKNEQLNFYFKFCLKVIFKIIQKNFHLKIFTITLSV